MFTSITYAYFTAFNSQGSTAEISFGPGKMLIEYADKLDALSLTKTNIQPSDTVLIDKTFTLTGTNTATADGGITMPFTISLEYQNTFQNYELYYFFKRTNENENIVVNIIDMYGVGVVIEDFGFPEEVLNYYFGGISDSSGETYTQEIASGYFKPSSEKQTVTFNLKMMFLDTGENQDYNKGATFNGKIVINSVESPEPIPFAEDSWETIANNVKNGNASKYKVGTEKEVEIDGTSYTVRVANNSSPEECNGEDFSQTACGFVVEFVDIIEKRKINEANSNIVEYPSTTIRTYANGEFFNKLPSELQNVIIETKVISGFRNDPNTTNYTSTDKIYLLSPHEVLENATSLTDVSTLDSAYSNSRQLDYYKNLSLTRNEYNLGRKSYNDELTDWWLRGSYINEYTSYDHAVMYSGPWDTLADNVNIGFAPAFRIG